MLTSRYHSLLFFFAFLGLVLGSCQTGDEPQPTAAPMQQLATGSWRLDQIQQNGQTSSSGASIKDRYSLTFRADGTYTQKILAGNDSYNGTWMLMRNNTVLHFKDHKGDDFDYTLVKVSTSELRYNFTNKANQLEERVFSAQP